MKTVKKVRKLPHKLKKRFKRKVRTKTTGKATTSGNSTASKSLLNTTEAGNVPKNDRERSTATVVQFSDIDVGVSLNIMSSGINDGTDGSDKISSRHTSASSNIGDAVTSRQYENKTAHHNQQLFSTQGNTLRQQTQSQKSLLNSSSKVSEHQMRRNSSKNCTCTKKDVYPCQWDDTGNSMVHLTDLVYTRSRIWGRVLVSNVNFEKRIFVRWSQNNWESYSEQQASFQEEKDTTDSQLGDKDAFTFEIMRPQDGKTVELAVRYCVCDEEFWDNNEGTNYQVTGTLQ